jgi:hypothetical protein
LSIRLTFYDQRGVAIFYLDSKLPGPNDERSEAPVNKIVCRLERMPLLAGSYRVNAALYDGRTKQDHVEGVLNFEVHPGFMDGRPTEKERGYGSVAVPHRWRFTG